MQLEENERIEDMKWVRRDGTWHRALPKVGDHCWFLGEIEELQGKLKITAIRKELSQITVKPIDNHEEGFGGWVVWWKDITYKEPPIPTESYLYGTIEG